MSHPLPHDSSDGHSVFRPQNRSRRTFELPSAPSTPPTDAMPTTREPLEPLATSGFGSYASDGRTADTNNSESATPSRNKSFLNLTSSTLFGIYQPAGFGMETNNPTPLGTGAQTPAESRNGSVDFSRLSSFPDAAFHKDPDGKVRRSTAPEIHKLRRPRKSFRGYFLPLMGRLVALFGVGVLYGLLIGHLHDRRHIAPVKVELDRSRWSYLLGWGFIGALLGEVLPWADVLWQPEEGRPEPADAERRRKNGRSTDAWMDVVRSIAAFVGIAFAIRKLPWQSTLQLSLTMALANPALWYLIDRSPPGFIVSSIVSLSGTALVLAINPALMASPSPWQAHQGDATRHGTINDTVKMPDNQDLVLGIFSQESVGVATWIASVLFVSSVCFGNIGRRLAPQRP